MQVNAYYQWTNKKHFGDSVIVSKEGNLGMLFLGYTGSINNVKSHECGYRRFQINNNGIYFYPFNYDNDAGNSYNENVIPYKIYGIKFRSPYILSKSFDSAKADIVSSSLGVQLGLTEETSWDEIINKIISSNYEIDYKTTIINSALGKNLGVSTNMSMTQISTLLSYIVDYSNTIQTATTDASNQSKSCYRINGEYIDVVPARGLWNNWNWLASCIKVPKTSVFTSGTSFTLYGSGANTSLIKGWTGQSSITVTTNGQCGYGTITSTNSIDLTAVKSIQAYHSYGSSGGCGSYNSYKNCAGHWSQSVQIQIYGSTNTTLITQCDYAAGSCVCDVSTVKEVCYIRVNHRIGHSAGGSSTSTITSVTMIM